MYRHYLCKFVLSITFCFTLLISCILPVTAAEQYDTGIAAHEENVYFENSSNVFSTDTEFTEHNGETESTVLPEETETPNIPPNTELPGTTESDIDMEVPSYTTFPENSETGGNAGTSPDISTDESTEILMNTETSSDTENTVSTETDEFSDDTTLEFLSPERTELPEAHALDMFKTASSSFYPNIINGSVIDGYCTYKVTASQISSSNAYSVIQKILNLAANNASASVPYKILIEPGTYTLTRSLRIYSNTYLYMEGVTFIQTKSLSANMIKVGDMSDKQSGYFYENITIDGGTTGGFWNENGNSNTAIKVGHASNFTMLNITVENSTDSHLMEVAGVNGLTLRGCTFKDQTLISQKYYEAVQLDYLITGHMSGYTTEDLANKNIIVDQCTFQNVPRGVGNHTSILNSYLDNIQITNNTFINNNSCPIQLLSCTNAVISGNTLTQCPRGIVLYAVRGDCRGTFLPSTPANESGIPTTTPDDYIAPPLNQNIVIIGNTISLEGADPYESSYENVGIFLGGYNYTLPQTPESGDTIPAGDYYISGATVSGNVISTTSVGIVLQNTKNTLIGSGNQISFSGSNNNCNGILLRSESTDNIIRENTISSCPGNGISINSSSTVSVISGNLVESPTTCGIYVSNSAIVTSVFGNTVSAAGYSGIYCALGRIDDIAQNTVLSGNGNGIYINGGVCNTILQNTVQAPLGNGIHMNKATVGSITGNSILSCGGTAISANICVINKISSNTIRQMGSYGIELNAGFTNTVNSNTVKSCTGYSIIVYNNASIKKITQNTVKSGNNIGIYVNTISSNLKVGSNIVSKCKSALIYISPDSYDYTITASSNKLTGTSAVIGILANSGKVTLYSNKIYSCAAPVQLLSTVKGTVKKNTYAKNKTNTATIVTSTGTRKKYKNLSAPSSVQARAKSKTSIQLNWKKVSNADGYRIYRSVSKNGSYRKIATLTKSKQTTYTDKKLKRNKKYYYKIVAYRKGTGKNTIFVSPNSKIVSKKTLKK